MTDVVSLLDRVVYGMGQADRLLGVRGGTTQRWIDGYSRSGRRYAPLVRPEPTGSDLVTWGEFVECRLLAEYRDKGIRIFRMRESIMALREEFGTPYPLAMARPFLETEGRELVMQIQESSNLQPDLRFVVRSGQGILPSEGVRRFGAVTDYDNGVAQRITLLGTVVIDPDYACGEPTIQKRPLRAAVIAEAVAAGEPRSDVAEMWAITPQSVDDAVLYSNSA